MEEKQERERRPGKGFWSLVFQIMSPGLEVELARKEEKVDKQTQRIQKLGLVILNWVLRDSSLSRTIHETGGDACLFQAKQLHLHYIMNIVRDFQKFIFNERAVLV